MKNTSIHFLKWYLRFLIFLIFSKAFLTEFICKIQFERSNSKLLCFQKKLVMANRSPWYLEDFANPVSTNSFYDCRSMMNYTIIKLLSFKIKFISMGFLHILDDNKMVGLFARNLIHFEKKMSVLFGL